MINSSVDPICLHFLQFPLKALDFSPINKDQSVCREFFPLEEGESGDHASYKKCVRNNYSGTVTRLVLNEYVLQSKE